VKLRARRSAARAGDGSFGSGVAAAGKEWPAGFDAAAGPLLGVPPIFLLTADRCATIIALLSDAERRGE